MFELPINITTSSGDVYGITNKGDYRMVLDCFNALNDTELSEDERVLASLLIFYNDIDLEDIDALGQDTYVELVKAMFNFMRCEEEDDGKQSNFKLIDWNKDANIIAAGINNVAKIEIRAVEYMHWYTFMGYYMSVGESVLSTVVGIRHKIATGKKLEKYEKEFKNDNPNYFNIDSRTVEQKEADDFVRSIWNNQKDGE